MQKYFKYFLWIVKKYLYLPKQNQITMKKATLTIELNGQVHCNHTYSYRKPEAVKSRLEALIKYLRKAVPHYSNATFTITL